MTQVGPPTGPSAGLLAGPLGTIFDTDLVAGVHLWSSPLDVDYVRGVVRRGGWRFGHLDGSRVVTVEDLHDAISGALGFPSYYGRNLDALADCLADCDGSQLLLWDDWGGLARTEPRVTAIVLDLLGASRVTTLLRGAGAAPTGGGFLRVS